MRRIKFISFLMAILSSLMVFSIGFSSWIEVIYPNAGSTSKKFEAYEVTELEIHNTNMSVFQFSALSFKTITYDGSGNLTAFQDTNTGTITVTYTIPQKSVQSAGGNLSLTAWLGYDATTLVNKPSEDFKLFKNASQKTGNKITVTLNGTTNITGWTFDENDQITFSTNLTGLDQSNDYVFTVTYTFEIPTAYGPDDHHFRNTFGKYITGTDGSGNSTKFIASASIISP